MRILPLGKADGFTLFEIIIVLVILGAAAAIVVPSFVGGLGGIQLETVTRDLITCMKKARSDAVAQQKTFRILLKTNPNGAARYSLADEFQKPIKDFDLPKGITFVERQIDREINEEGQVVSFYSNGRSSGGSIVVKNSKGRKIRVEVDPITGFGKMVKDDPRGGFR